MGALSIACGGQFASDASPDSGGAAQDAAQSDTGARDAGGDAVASDASVDVTSDGGGEVDDIAVSFSSASNPTPTGHFQYGVTQTLGGAFALYSMLVVAQGLPIWQGSASPNTPPYVGKNTTSQTVVFFNAVTLPAGTVWVHPGPAGEYTVIRWTCPGAGNYLANATFVARDSTTTNVAVLKNGVTPPLFTGNVAPGFSPTFAMTLSLQTGDTIDLAVGYGLDGHYNSDSTGVAGSFAMQ